MLKTYEVKKIRKLGGAYRESTKGKETRLDKFTNAVGVWPHLFKFESGRGGGFRRLDFDVERMDKLMEDHGGVMAASISLAAALKLGARCGNAQRCDRGCRHWQADITNSLCISLIFNLIIYFYLFIFMFLFIYVLFIYFCMYLFMCLLIYVFIYLIFIYITLFNDELILKLIHFIRN